MEILLDAIKIGSPTIVLATIFYLIIKELLKGSREREKEVMNIITNHMSHNSEVLKEVSERTKEDTKATKETQQVLQGLKETLLKINGNKNL